jgi:hypothetical protein
MRPFLVAACLLVAACSKSSTSSTSDAGPSSSGTPSGPDDKLAHPCSVLQRSDAESILGTTDLHEEEEPGIPGDARCAWSRNGGRGRVELRIHVPSRKEGFDNAVPDRSPIPGLGDSAYARKRLSWGHVDVLKGDQTFFVQVQPGDAATGHGESPDKAREQAIALARTIVTRI